MSQREFKKKPAPQKTTSEEAPAKSPAEVGDALKSELDDLLDEIDGVLEENAETFVKDYVQKGGQ